ncbi:MAG: DUF58 domain-containing protein [Acidobacteriota bacterium]
MIPSRFALTLLGALGLLAVVGFGSPPFVYALAAADGLWLALVLVDGLAARHTPLAARRALPAGAHQDEPLVCELVIENRGRRPARVRVRDVLAPELADRPHDAELVVPAGRTAVHRIRIRPRRRGDARLAPLALRVRGPLGLAWATREADADRRVRVLPKAHLEGEAGLLVRQALERRLGRNPRVARGISQELYALREYLPGDEYRMIHWKQTARLLRPVTRETSWEQHQHIVLLVDCGRPMASLAGGMSKLDHALAAVLALLRVVVAQQDSATLVLFAQEIERVVRVDRRTRSFRAVFERVYDRRADLEEPDYRAAAAWSATQVPRSSLAILVTSVIDLVGAEELGRALAGLSRRHRALLVNLEDPGLIDLARAVPGDATEAFAKVSALRLLAANRELAARLRARGIDSVSLPASRLAVGVIQRYLDFKARRRF